MKVAKARNGKKLNEIEVFLQLFALVAALLEIVESVIGV